MNYTPITSILVYFTPHLYYKMNNLNYLDTYFQMYIFLFFYEIMWLLIRNASPIFSFLKKKKNVYCGYSLEVPHKFGSTEYHNIILWISFFLLLLKRALYLDLQYNMQTAKPPMSLCI